MGEVGFVRCRELVSRNAAPWHVGKPRSADADEGVPWLCKLGGAKGEERVAKAREARWAQDIRWSRSRRAPYDIRHPVLRNRHYTDAVKRERIAAALIEARQRAGLAEPR